MTNAHQSLTKQQSAILTLIARFRFITTRHVQKKLKIKYVSNVQPRLNWLIGRGLIGRKYESEFKLAGRPAAYFLMPKGMRALRELRPEIDRAALHAAYKDVDASDDFIRRCLMVADTHLALSTRFGGQFEFFTKSESRPYDYFPQPLPDAYIRIPDETRSDDNPVHFFLEVCQTSRPPFALRSQLKRYVSFAEDGLWPETTGTRLPPVLLLCDTDELAKKLKRTVNALLEDTFEDDLEFKVLTMLDFAAWNDKIFFPKPAKSV